MANGDFLNSTPIISISFSQQICRIQRFHRSRRKRSWKRLWRCTISGFLALSWRRHANRNPTHDRWWRQATQCKEKRVSVVEGVTLNRCEKTRLFCVGYLDWLQSRLRSNSGNQPLFVSLHYIIILLYQIHNGRAPTNRARVRERSGDVHQLLLTRDAQRPRLRAVGAAGEGTPRAINAIHTTLYVWSKQLRVWAMPVAVKIVAGGNNIRQYRRDLSFSRARLLTRVG